MLTFGDWLLSSTWPSACIATGVAWPAEMQRWVNVKRLYEVTTGCSIKSNDLRALVSSLGLDFQGHIYSALDRCANMARCVPVFLEGLAWVSDQSGAPDHLPLMLMLEVQFGDDYQARQMPAGEPIRANRGNSNRATTNSALDIREPSTTVPPKRDSKKGESKSKSKNDSKRKKCKHDQKSVPPSTHMRIPVDGCDSLP
eukprot:TRINITY_DN8682_c0_g1_i2.p1 TRINITY_DN8682_c0_g1~~TRINITY_DN8682_c0_g1_i2.p1  ORF type:complete len:199 (-),score=27.78 TRINITY_DN8682_c0_g1_i2:102-698(-)